MQITHYGPANFPFTLTTEGGLKIDSGNGPGFWRLDKVKRVIVMDQHHLESLIAVSYIVPAAEWEVQYLPVRERK